MGYSLLKAQLWLVSGSERPKHRKRKNPEEVPSLFSKVLVAQKNIRQTEPMRFSRESLSDRIQNQTEHERTSIKKATGEGWGVNTQVKHIRQQRRKTEKAKHDQDTSFKINTT